MRGLALGFLVACCALAAAIVISTAFDTALAQTDAEKAACKPDAMRLCSLGDLLRAGAGDREGIFQCFKTHRRELSPPCNQVLRHYGH